MATIQDIGRELGLSPMTVSRALNGHAGVREETRRRILDQAAKVNYRPNRWARSLVTRRSHVIGVVVPSISHTFFSDIIGGIQDEIENEAYDLMLCHSRGDRLREHTEIEMLLSSRVDGLIIASNLPETSPGILLDLLQQRTPCVMLDRFFQNLDFPSVQADDFAVGKLATEHLISLGHRDIAHISGPPMSVSRLRREGFVATMRRHGLEIRDEWIVTSDFTVEGGYESMRRILETGRPPTAVFAANDPGAVGVFEACRQAGLSVPGDVSLVGAGCVENTFCLTPFLTTVEWARREMGSKAAEVVLSLIAGKPMEKLNWTFTPNLLIRQSTKLLGSTVAKVEKA
jgi:LacI family transcriptional regulator, galactose operon repressor